MILVFGSNGQIATALKKDLAKWPSCFISSAEANFLNPIAVVKVLQQTKPKIIICAAAYTMVDQAESEQETAYKINTLTIAEIAAWAAENEVPFIHFSTDYVFPGLGSEPMDELSITSPVNFYGQSKLDGEKRIQAAGGPHYIFRLSWVYSPWGKNFPKTILRLAQQQDEISIVNDQHGSPTDAREVSAFVRRIINEDGESINFTSGLYHLSFREPMTWFEFAHRIVAEAKATAADLKLKNIHAITTEEFKTPAKRPLNSRLKTRFSYVQSVVDEVKKEARTENWNLLT
jgi:dTDP-4-dehydrorhamnose reductase